MSNEFSIIDHATLYARRYGCEAFPLIGKVPAHGHQWNSNSLGRPGVQAASAAAWAAATGYALAPLPARPGQPVLVFLDIDDRKWYEDILIAALPRIADAPGSERGDHLHKALLLQVALPHASVKIQHGKREIASLRGHGAYVVGPRSTHPSGELYQPVRGKTSGPLALDLAETLQLLALFGIDHQPGQAQAMAALQNVTPGTFEAKPEHVSPALVARLLERFQDAGYRPRYDAEKQLVWFNGKCPNHAAHDDGDNHSSFGYNSKGVGYCFVCGFISSVDLAQMLGVNWRPAIRRPQSIRSERAELIAQGHTRAARLMDMIDHFLRSLRSDRSPRSVSANGKLSVRQLLHIGRNVGWSRPQTFRNIRLAVEAGLLRRVHAGQYEIARALESAPPAKRGGAAYSEHPAEYRRAVLRIVEREMQADEPTAFCPTSGQIAYRAGISRRTLYRYEGALGITRLPVWVRSQLPSKHDPDLGVRVPYLPPERGTYRRLEVVTQADTVRRFDLTHVGFDDDLIAQALGLAHDVAKRYGGVVLLAERRPSVRVLPHQRIRERLPQYARLELSDSGFRVFVDPPWLFGAKSPDSVAPVGARGAGQSTLSQRFPRTPSKRSSQSGHVSGQAELCGPASRPDFNDSDLSAKHEIYPDQLDAEQEIKRRRWFGEASGAFDTTPTRRGYS